jgi:hypothetical protein
MTLARSLGRRGRAWRDLWCHGQKYNTANT